MKMGVKMRKNSPTWKSQKDRRKNNQTVNLACAFLVCLSLIILGLSFAKNLGVGLQKLASTPSQKPLPAPGRVLLMPDRDVGLRKNEGRHRA